jgi:hypothetical protein
MNCISCNDLLNDSKDVNKDTRRYPIKLEDGNTYCQGCADAQGMFNSPTKKTTNKENIAPPSETTQKKQIKQSVSIITFICVKCRIQASGNKCESCGHPSPLFRKKK